MTPKNVCLQCDESREAVKANGYICGIMSGGESPELSEEWPRHHWADWTNAELARFGITPEHFDKYRRASVFDLQYVSCDHTAREHVFDTTGNDMLPPDYVCMRCWTDTRENP